MAIVLEANYSKKLGLPGYSSHQFSVSLRTEVMDLNQVEAESARLHDLLQASVDREIQKTGFLPVNSDGNGHASGNGHSGPARQGSANGDGPETWACSPRQRARILKIVEENNLDKNQVEALALGRFGKSVKALNKPQASGLIAELVPQIGGTNNGNHWHPVNGRTNPTSTP